MKEVVGRLAINPNTVLKAYRELEHSGLVAARSGVGTFVTGSIADPAIAAHAPLRRELRGWILKARRAALMKSRSRRCFARLFAQPGSKG